MKYPPLEIQNEEGSALLTVLIVIVIITVFIGAVLFGIVIQNRFIQEDINETKARYAAEAGIAVFLDNTPYRSIKRDTSTTFFIQDSTEIRLTAKPFGGFLDIESKAHAKGKEKTIRVLAGALSTDVFEYAVVLGDTSSVLMVTGSTQMKGDILTGQIGTRSTDFKGTPFSGSIEGEREQRRGELLPDFDMEFITNQEERFGASFNNEQYRAYLSRYEGSSSPPVQEKDTLYFEESISWVSQDSIACPDDLTIVVNGNAVFNGNYHFGRFTRIIVKDTLQVGGSVTGHNLLLYAGKSIQIGGSAALSAQAISGDDIIIRDNAYLKYPSLLYSGQEFSEERKEYIIDIRGESIVDGTVLYPIQTNNFTSELFRIRVSDQATVRGGIYTLGQTELEGTVLGTLLTRQFYFYESPSSYINWLRNVVIDTSERPAHYVIPLGFSENPEYEILDWFEVE